MTILNQDLTSCINRYEKKAEECSPHVSIIILNWNNWRDTLDCLDSLYRIDYDNYTIILVDNHSSDDSISHIERYCCRGDELSSKKLQHISHSNSEALTWESNLFVRPPEGKLVMATRNILFLIKNDQNYGFAGGNNIGIRFAIEHFPSKYLLLLNNDTVHDPEFLKKLVEGFEKYPHAGFAGPKIYYYDTNGRSNIINHAGIILHMPTGIVIHRGDTRVDVGQYDQLEEVDSLTGACLLVKREIIEKIGLLNTDYFLYWEDTEWCLRGRRAEYSCIYVPSSRIWHRVGSSAKSATFYYYYTRNRFWFIWKYAGSLKVLTFLFFFFFIDIWRNLGCFLLHGDLRKKSLFSFLRGIKDGICHKKKNSPDRTWIAP